MILIIILYSLCASTFTISKWGLQYTEPLFFMALRMVLAGLMLVSYYFVQQPKIYNKQLRTALRSDWWLFMQVILFHIFLTYICDICALKQLSSGESAFLYNLSPFITAFFSYRAFSETMTLKKWFGLLLGFFSLVPGFLQEAYQGRLFVTLTPKLLTLAAVVFSAYGWVVVRKLVKDKQYSSIFVNGVGMFFGGLLGFIASLSTEQWSPAPVTQWWPFLQALVLIILNANLLFYNLYGYLLKKYTATFLSFAGFLCPVFASLLGWFFLAEPVPVYLLVSLCLVIVGLYIFYQEELRQGYIKST